MTSRRRIGARRHRATFSQHDGTVDSNHGTPTYTEAGDWDTVVAGWPCELTTVQGGETLRGRQVAAETTHVLFGDYWFVSSVTPDMRVTVTDPLGNSVIYSVVSAYDPAGDSREMRVEAKREVN